MINKYFLESFIDLKKICLCLYEKAVYNFQQGITPSFFHTNLETPCTF